MKKFFLILLFLLVPSKLFAAEEITLDITEDSYIDSIQFYDFQAEAGRMLLGFGDTTGNGITHIFLKYSNENLLDRLITPDRIEKVVLRMYQYRNKHGTDYDITVAEPETNWSEWALSWNNQPLLKNRQLGSQTITSSLTWKEIDVTNLVIKQLWDFEGSFGIVLSAKDEFLSGGSFWTSNCQNPILPPFCSEPLFPHIKVTLKEDAKLVLISPDSAEEIEKEEVQLKWEFNKENELYLAEISDDSNFTDILKTSNWIAQENFNLSALENGKYYWRVKTYFSQLTSGINSFRITSQQEELHKKDLAAEKKEDKEIIETIPEVKGAATSKQSELGYCKYRYNSTNREIRRIRCKLEQPEIPRIDHILSKDGVYWLDTEVWIPEKFDIFIELTRCRARTIWNPATWLGCSEEILETVKETSDVRGSIWAVNQGKKIDGYKTKLSGGKYKINFPLTEDMAGKKFLIRYDTSYAKQLDGSVWLDIFEFSPQSNSATIPKVKISKSDTHPYRFPFEKIIGVTQWYGNTDYQHPHTGIDFGAKLEPVFAPADGKIIYAGWDNGKNKCLSGGNYVLLEHKGGKHTVFLHLKDFLNEKGESWKTGNKVKKGQRIGTTGNSGLYNCETLGYHLHFETRNSKSAASHTDPVPLVNVDWNKVLTLGAGSYRGRLSGKNPHPGK